jgi:hypothetical protein
MVLPRGRDYSSKINELSRSGTQNPPLKHQGFLPGLSHPAGAANSSAATNRLLPEDLQDAARMVGRLSPYHGDPERFVLRREEAVQLLLSLAHREGK